MLGFFQRRFGGYGQSIIEGKEQRCHSPGPLSLVARKLVQANTQKKLIFKNRSSRIKVGKSFCWHSQEGCFSKSLRTLALVVFFAMLIVRAVKCNMCICESLLIYEMKLQVRHQVDAEWHSLQMLLL